MEEKMYEKTKKKENRRILEEWGTSRKQEDEIPQVSSWKENKKNKGRQN